jgi:endonuclease G
MMQWMRPAVLLLAVLQVLSAQPGRFSTPACDSSDRELASRSFFLVCYSSSLKVPVWTAYELLPAQLGGSAERPSRFRHDPGLVGPSALDADYRSSGFSRGHMVPAEDLAFSDASIQATFLLSNVAPQRQALNAGRWRQLENAVRRIAAQSDAVYVFTGPVFDAPEAAFIGTSRVAVPTHFYKVILAVEGDRKILYAAILPNAEQVEEGLNQFAATVDEVERRTGLDFFSALADSEEGPLESVRRLFPAPGVPLAWAG